MVVRTGKAAGRSPGGYVSRILDTLFGGGGRLTPDWLGEQSKEGLERRVDLDAVLEGVVDGVTRRLLADRGTLFLVDRAAGELVSRVAHLPEVAEIRVPIGEGVAGQVAASGEPIRVDDGSRDPRVLRRIDTLTGYRTRSLLAVPVFGPAGGVVAVLQLLNKKSGCFSAEDTARLVALAPSVAEILQRTSLGPQLESTHPRPLAFRLNHVVGESPAMRVVFERVLRAARTEVTVLLRGESGTGKELIARAIHDNSARSEGPFVKVDCAALPESVIENELFGHERGAYTGAAGAAPGKVDLARGGTLFLDEIGELSLTVQGKLLRLLQDRTYLRVGGQKVEQVDARIVCATWRDLEAAVAQGNLRRDLYYRLRVVEILLPALRERGRGDLDRLIDHLLWGAARRHGRPGLELSPEARERLLHHDWPGNVRELENTVESAVVLAPGSRIEAENLELGPRAFASQPAPELLRTLDAVETEHIERVLAAVEGNRSEAARILGISRNTLARRLHQLGR